MQLDSINTTRYRTLVIALGLSCVLALSAAVIAWRLPGARWYEWTIFLVVAVLFAAMMPLAVAVRRRGDRAGLERIAAAMLVIGGLAMLQRMVWAAFGSWLDDPAANPFRPVFQFLPFFYIAAIALLRARRALNLCWVGWALATLIAVAGLARAPGLLLEREGAFLLLVWLLVANPLFIMLLHALPQYEAALEASNAEVARMRERTELLDRLAESERRFNLVVQSLQVGVWDRWLGPPQRRWWSPRFYDLIGYTPEELPPDEASLRALMHPDERDTVWARGTRQLLAGDIVDVNFRLRTKHRGYRWFNSHAKADRDETGRIVRIAGAIADIHEQRTAEHALNEAKVELTRLAYHDTLTELHNRRAFDDRFQLEWDRSRRSGEPLSLLLIDLDYFKAYNDSYGHTAGDQCLHRAATCIAQSLRRASDFTARLGGEEFAVLLPDTDESGAVEMAQTVVEALRALDIRHEGSPLDRVTGSVGAATSGSGIDSAATLYERADLAMYEVKRRGRDGLLHEQAMRMLPVPVQAQG